MASFPGYPACMLPAMPTVEIPYEPEIWAAATAGRGGAITSGTSSAPGRP